MHPQMDIIAGLVFLSGACFGVAAYLQAKQRKQANAPKGLPVPTKKECEMPYEQTDVEVEIAGILDRLGCEMQAASRRLRTAPYCTVEDFLKKAKRTLERVDIAAATMKAGCYNTTLELLRLVEVPEIDFTDADEDEPAKVSTFFDAGA